MNPPCVKCKHYVWFFFERFCHSPHRQKYNPVTGKIDNMEILCEVERNNDYTFNCGIEGKYFEPKKGKNK